MALIARCLPFCPKLGRRGGGSTTNSRSSTARRPSLRMPRAIRLLEADPDLGTGLSRDQRTLAARRLVLPVSLVPAGSWSPPALQHAAPLGILLIDGLICRRVTVRHRHGVELLGPGDLVRPAADHDADPDMAISWSVCVPARTVVLGDAFLAAARPWTPILCELVARAERRATAMATVAAIARAPRLEWRLLSLLWFVAERWGYVRPDGVIIPLKLPQAILGDLVRADRSSVNRALRRLQARQAIAPHANGWRLDVVSE